MVIKKLILVLPGYGSKCPHGYWDRTCPKCYPKRVER